MKKAASGLKTHPCDVWSQLTEQADFRKQRNLFSPILGNPLWWLVNVKITPKKISSHIDEASSEIWRDPRFDVWKGSRRVLRAIARRRKASTMLRIASKTHSDKTFAYPLIHHRNHVYFLCLTFLSGDEPYKAHLSLLHSNLKMLLKQIHQQFEIHHLTESIRPRMLALSTVHTIHRLSNSAMNLDELYGNLSSLTAQVMRAKECSIWMSEKSKGRKKKLVERGRSSKNRKLKYRVRQMKVGEGREGRVFSTAKHVMGKNVLCLPIIDDDVMGVVTVRNKRDGKSFDQYDKEVLMTLSEEAAVAIKSAELSEEQKRVTFETIQSLATILGTRFAPQTRIKSKTLLKIMMEMSDRLKLSTNDQQALHYATLLKDASKIGLPDKILKKSAKLTGEEYQLVREHPVHGANMIKSFKSLKPVAPIILYSHENFDGSGYPYGLKGAAIPLGARILSVINAFDALIGGRPYKRGKSVQEALEELHRNGGTQFDPHVVDVFQSVVQSPRIMKMLNRDGGHS